MPKCIYREHYFDKIGYYGKNITLDFYHTKKQNISSEEFVQKAIFLSKKERLSLDVLEDNRKIIADFIVKSVVLAPESTDLLEELVAASDLVEILFTDKLNPVVIMRLELMKT